MPAKLALDGAGVLLFSDGDIDAVYGIASLSKIWAAALLYDRLKISAVQRSTSIDVLLNENISCEIDYEAKLYNRMDARPDLLPPDNPLTYQPFRKEKMRFRLPVEKGKSYRVRDLFEAALFQSKNDAIQILVDHFFDDADDISFRAASTDLAQKLGLVKTKIGDPHGLCDGDNVSSAKELGQFCGFLIREGYLDFFGKFDPIEKDHTARPLLDDQRMARNNIKLVLVKTATGSNRQGNDSAESALAIAKIGGQFKIALTLSDADRFGTMTDLLDKGSLLPNDQRD